MTASAGYGVGWIQYFRTKASSQIFSLGPPSVFSYLDDFAVNPLCALDASSGDPVGDRENSLEVLGHFLDRLSFVLMHPVSIVIY